MLTAFQELVSEKFQEMGLRKPSLMIRTSYTSQYIDTMTACSILVGNLAR